MKPDIQAIEYRKADGKDRPWSITNDPHYMAAIVENPDYETRKLCVVPEEKEHAFS